MKKLLFSFFLSLIFLSVNAQEHYTLSGYVSDEKGEMLIGVYVVVPNSTMGAVTNNYGFYSLTLSKGTYKIRYSFIGYEPQEMDVDLTASKKLNVSLNPQASELQEVTVTAERKDENVKDVNMSNVELQAKTIKRIPNLMGEVDIIKSIQLLPGVQSSVEGSSGFYVRGGNADQNLILLDGATVYNPSHLFGFFSVFNGDAVKNIELYKGGIPPEYGGRLSSVLDVRMNEGNTQKFKGSAGIGLISSRVVLEGPIIKDKASYIFTARRTYADLFLPFAKDTVARNSKLYFYDLNAKVNFQLNQNNRLFISGYFGRDVNLFDDMFQMNFGNATGTIRWNHTYNGKLFSNLTLIFSDFNYNLGVPQGSQSFKWLSHIIDFSISNDYAYYINPSNTVKFGFQSTYHTIKPGRTENVDSTSFIISTQFPNSHAIESAVFASYEQKIGSQLTIQYGLRFSIFQNIGSGTIYNYDADYNHIDSTVYPRGEIFNTYTSLEPRLNIRYSINDKSSVKASYNRTAQYLQLASNSTATFPLDMWFMSNPNIKPQKADQVALGYFRNFKNNAIEASCEVFYKKIYNAIDFKDHAELVPQLYLDGQLRIGSAYAYGVEFLVRKNAGKLTGWISYSYMRSFRHIPAINNGKKYPPPYDKPNNVSVVVNYSINKRWDAGLNWVYSTAMPVTVPTGGFYYGGILIPKYSGRNGTRIPGTAYHRLDLSITCNFKTYKWDSNLNLSIYNVYDRHNAFAINFRDKSLAGDNKNGSSPGIEVVKLYLFPIIPALTYNINF